MNTTVRFHLARGEYYRHWQVKCGLEVNYYDPSPYSLILWNCRLQNHTKTAQRIRDGANKSVCAWVECEMVEIHVGYPQEVIAAGEIAYSPRVTPHCVREGRECDKATFRQMITNESKLFWVQEHEY